MEFEERFATRERCENPGCAWTRGGSSSRCWSPQPRRSRHRRARRRPARPRRGEHRDAPGVRPESGERRLLGPRPARLRPARALQGLALPLRAAVVVPVRGARACVRREARRRRRDRARRRRRAARVRHGARRADDRGADRVRVRLRAGRGAAVPDGHPAPRGRGAAVGPGGAGLHRDGRAPAPRLGECLRAAQPAEAPEPRSAGVAPVLRRRRERRHHARLARPQPDARRVHPDAGPADRALDRDRLARDRGAGGASGRRVGGQRARLRRARPPAGRALRRAARGGDPRRPAAHPPGRRADQRAAPPTRAPQHRPPALPLHPLYARRHGAADPAARALGRAAPRADAPRRAR